jgi:hypothetical protein
LISTKAINGDCLPVPEIQALGLPFKIDQATFRNFRPKVY